jgi:hypothetical protein
LTVREEIVLNIKRLLSLAALGALIVAGCEDTKPGEPPPPVKSITHGIYFTRTFDSNGMQNGLQDNDVFDMHVASDGRMWIGNRAGLAIYPNVRTTIREAAFDQNNGLPNPWVRRIVEHNGQVYVGTWGVGGVGITDLNFTSWRTLSVADGLLDDSVSDIEVYNGMIYFATNKGVSLYDPIADTVASYVPLDAIVSDIEIAQTSRGLEFWYAPGVEFRIQPGTEADHGITIARDRWDAADVTVTLNPIKDNSMYSDTTTALSNALGEHIYAGTRAGMQRRGLVAFDFVGNIPTDAQIEKVTLRMRLTGGNTQSSSRVDLVRIQSDWGEGTSLPAGDESLGTAATSGDATWLHTFYPGSRWDSPGGDLAIARSARITVRDTTYYRWTTSNMAKDVKNWILNPSSNFGWLIRSDSLKQFDSRETSRLNFQPELEIVYKEVLHLTTVDSDLPEPNINQIRFDDNTGLFWMAFATKGLGYLDMDSATWRFYTTSDGLPSNSIYSITEVDGVLWVATQNGIARQRSSGSWQPYNTGGGLKEDRVRRLYSDDPTRIWLSYIEAGGGSVDPRTAQ